MSKNKNRGNIDNLGKFTQKEIYEISTSLNKTTQQKDLISKIAKDLINKKSIICI